jgi:hypothetical protein
MELQLCFQATLVSCEDAPKFLSHVEELVVLNSPQSTFHNYSTLRSASGKPHPHHNVGPSSASLIYDTVPGGYLCRNDTH